MLSSMFTSATGNDHTERNDSFENSNYNELAFDVVEKYFEGQHLAQLVRHQVESMDDFYSHQAAKTIDMFNPVSITSEQDLDKDTGKHRLEISVSFENYHMSRAQIHENNGATKLMFPQEARLRNFTYSSAVTVDIHIKYIVRQGENLDNIHTFHKILPKIHIGKLPIMLNSNICILKQYKHVDVDITGECRFDAGGYFIINGSEKTVLCQERAAENRIQVFNVSKNNAKWTWCAEMKSVPDFKRISPKQINMMISAKNNGFGHGIYVQVPRMKIPLPLFVIFRALNVISDKDICRHILLNTDDQHNKELLFALQGSIIDANKVATNEDAIKTLMGQALFTPINMDKDQG